MVSGDAAIPFEGGHIAMMERIVGRDVPSLLQRAPWASSKLARVIDDGLGRRRDPFRGRPHRDDGTDRRTRRALALAACPVGFQQARAGDRRWPRATPRSLSRAATSR